MNLPEYIDPASFDAMQGDTARWHEVVASIAAKHSSAPCRPTNAGTVLVGLVGDTRVVKLYPPFLRDHFEFEQAALQQLGGRLSVPTPELVASGECRGWPYLVMTQLAGEPLTRVWTTLPGPRKCELLDSLGQLAAEVHALPPRGLQDLAPAWPLFLQAQHAGCRQRQQRTQLPVQLQAQLEPFLAGEVPAGADVILTGEYTPMNLLYAESSSAGGLCGMFDFGDGLVGPREYDWLGPLCFLAAGHKERCDAFLAGYGAPLHRDWRPGLMRLLLLHRYSDLHHQIAGEGWQQAPNFEALAELVWP